MGANIDRYNYRAWWVERYFSISVSRNQPAISGWLTQLEDGGRVTDVIKIDDGPTGFRLIARVEGPVPTVEPVEAAVDRGVSRDQVERIVEDTITKAMCP